MPEFWMNMSHGHVWFSSCILTVMSDTEHLIQLPLSLGKMFPKNTKSPAKDKTWLWSLSPSSTNSFRQSCLRLSDRPWKSQTKESSEKWNQTSPFPLHGPLLPSWGKRPTVRGICPDFFYLKMTFFIIIKYLLLIIDGIEMAPQFFSRTHARARNDGDEDGDDIFFNKILKEETRSKEKLSVRGMSVFTQWYWK